MTNYQLLDVPVGPRYAYTGLVNRRQELLLVFPDACEHWASEGGGDADVHALLDKAKAIESSEDVRRVPVQLIPYGESCSYMSYQRENVSTWPYARDRKYTVKINGNPTIYHVEDYDERS